VALTNDSNPVKDIVIKNATITVKRAFSQDMSLFSSKEVKSSPCLKEGIDKGFMTLF